MTVKNLPIRFFEARKRDEQLTEAGGNSDLPKWVLKGNELSARSRHLSAEMNSVSALFEVWKSKDLKLPMVIATTISEYAIAKSHRGLIVNMLNSDGNLNVIGVDSGRNGGRRILSVVTTDELIGNVRKTLEDVVNSARLISSLEDLEPFEPFSEGYNLQNHMYRVRLIDYKNSEINMLARNLFKNMCSAMGITIEKEMQYSTEMYLYRIVLDTKEKLEMLLGFEGIYSVKEVSFIEIETDSLDQGVCVPVKTPEAGKSYPVIGVLDSGISRNNYLSPWLLSEKEVYYEEEFLNRHHGSMVASVVEYSDELNGTSYTATNGVLLLEAAVIPDTKKEKHVTTEDVLDNVEDAVGRHKDIKVWTMSVGTYLECMEGELPLS